MPNRPPLDAVTARWVPWVVAIAFFMQSLDGTILNTALPAMASDLAEDPLRMQGVIIAYMLTVALLIPASGWIADRFGTRKIFFGAILLFSLGSLLCALSSSLTLLIGARVIQGLGGALMLPVGRLVVLRAYPRSELVRIMGFITIPGLLGPLIGPTMGGWMVQFLTWHWIFLINLPVGLVGCYAVWKFIPDLRGSERTRFDSLGFVLFGAAMILITIAMEGLGELHLPHLRVMLLLFSGMACLAAYWLRAGHIDNPLFAPSLFKTRTFAVGILGNLFARLGSGALPFLVPLLLQVALGYSPSQAGMSMLPLAAAAMIAKWVARPLIERLGYRIVLTGNTLALGIMLASMGLVSEQTPYWLLLCLLAILGAINSLQFTAMNTVTLIDLDDASASSGNSLLSVVAQLSLSLGVACAGALLGGFTAEIGNDGVDTVLGAFQLTFVTVGIMAMLAATIFSQLSPKDGRRAVSREHDIGHWLRAAAGSSGSGTTTIRPETAGEWPPDWYTARHFVLQASPVTTIATAFNTLPLSAAMLANLDSLGYAQMTPIQAQSLPVILKGMDLIAQAKTGSGKTAAFGIGLLNPINPRYFGCQALILCPTRELADQVAKEIRRLARAEDNIKVLTLCGGVSLGPQIASLEHGAHIIVGTPGRIQQHLRKGSLVLHGLNTLILDEADRMLDMGFYDSIEEIIMQAPERRQTLLFSATYPVGIKQLAAKFMRNPQQVKAEALHDDSQIEQRFYEISPEDRMSAVTKVLGHFRPASCVAFCFTKQQVQETVDHLTAKGISAVGLHGDLEQRDRDQVLAMFANRSTSVLVATDVAARGLDIDSLDMVINVELARDSEIHIHRVGRTGRAGEKGLAISLVAPSEAQRAQAIEELQKTPLTWDQVDNLKSQGGGPLLPQMSTLCIAAGRKDKVRPGDILGALTGDAGIPGAQVGKIAIFDFQAYVAVERGVAKQALQRLNDGKIKGRSLRVRIL